MRNAGLDESPSGTKIAERNINNLRYADDTTLLAESEEELKNLLMKVKGTTEDEMVGWHHRLNGHGFGWTPGVVDGQGGPACCGSWGHRESDTTEQLN